MSIPGMSDWETTLDLPLRSIGDQIHRVEAHLREVAITAAGCPSAVFPKGAEAMLAVRLEAIRSSLEALESLVLDVEKQLAPGQTSPRASDDHGGYIGRTSSRHVDD